MLVNLHFHHFQIILARASIKECLLLNLVCTYVDKPEDKNYHPPPNFTELIRKAEELKAIGNKELLKLDDLMKEHMKTANDIKILLLP